MAEFFLLRWNWLTIILLIVLFAAWIIFRVKPDLEREGKWNFR